MTVRRRSVISFGFCNQGVGLCRPLLFCETVDILLQSIRLKTNCQNSAMLYIIVDVRNSAASNVALAFYYPPAGAEIRRTSLLSTGNVYREILTRK